MPEAEKQESQKTVVAFIAGLLIGGLLVWVFSSSPEAEPMEESLDTSSAVETDAVTETTTEDTTSEAVEQTTSTKPAPVSGEGVIVVADQPAGSVVTLDSTAFPAGEGWIGVREGARVLGAARYNLTDGLVPTEVRLLRATESGNTYEVVYYTDNGDQVFDLGDDAVVEGVSATFTAQ